MDWHRKLLSLPLAQHVPALGVSLPTLFCAAFFPCPYLTPDPGEIPGGLTPCLFKILQDRGLFFQGWRVQTEPYLLTIMHMGGTFLDVPSLLSSMVVVQTAPAAGESEEHMSGSSPLPEGWAGWREAAREEASLQVPLCTVSALSWRFCRSCRGSTGDATANETSLASPLTEEVQGELMD